MIPWKILEESTMPRSPLTALPLLPALLLSLLLVACGGGDGAPPADGGAGEADGVRHSDPASPEAARQTALALIQAFQSGNQERAEELFAEEGRWQTEQGFLQRAQIFQSTEFDLDSVQIYPEGNAFQVTVEGDVSAESPNSSGRRTFAFYTGNFDGVTKVGGIEVRVTGVP